MAKKVFLGMSAVVVELAGSFTETKGSQVAWILPILNLSKDMPKKEYTYISSHAGGGQNFLYKIDLAKRITPGEEGVEAVFDTAEIDGWGLNGDGTELPMPAMSMQREPPVLRHTTIGGSWPLHNHKGIVYLSSEFIRLNQLPLYNASVAGRLWPNESIGLEAGELITIAYSPKERYVGFKATVLSKMNGKSSISLRDRKGQPISGQFSIDFKERTQCDTEKVVYHLWDGKYEVDKTIQPLNESSNVGDTGIVFLNVLHVYKMSTESPAAERLLVIPKVPFYLDR
jgi:hypothetical protein